MLYLQVVVFYAIIEDIQASDSPTDCSNYQSLDNSIRSLQKSVLRQLIAAQGLHDYYLGQMIDPLEYNYIYQIKRSAFEKTAEDMSENYLKYQLDTFNYQSDIPDTVMVL